MLKREDELSNKIIGLAIEVHRFLVAALLQSAYEDCLCRKFAINNIAFERQKSFPINNKGIKVNCGYRLDIVVENY